MAFAFDLLGSGRVARGAVRLLAGRVRVRIVTSRTPAGAGVVDPGALRAGGGPLVIATSVDERRFLGALPAHARCRGALAYANLGHVLARLPPGALAGRLVIVVTNPVEPIVDALARLEPTARVVGFGLSVDRARFADVLAVAARVDPADDSARARFADPLAARADPAGRVARSALRWVPRVNGTHAGGAIACVDAHVEPHAWIEALRRYRSPFAPRALDGAALDALAAAVEREPIGERARALIEGAARVLCAAEHVDGAPPALRGAVELARTLRALAGGRSVLMSTERGPCVLA